MVLKGDDDAFDMVRGVVYDCIVVSPLAFNPSRDRHPSDSIPVLVVVPLWSFDF